MFDTQKENILFAVYPVYQDKAFGLRTDYRFICFPIDVTQKQMLHSLKDDNEGYVIFHNNAVRGVRRKNQIELYALEENETEEPEEKYLSIIVDNRTVPKAVKDTWDYAVRTHKVHLFFQVVSLLLKAGLKTVYANYRAEVGEKDVWQYAEQKFLTALHRNIDLKKFYKELKAVWLYDREKEKKFQQVFYVSIALLEDVMYFQLENLDIFFRN